VTIDCVSGVGWVCEVVSNDPIPCADPCPDIGGNFYCNSFEGIKATSSPCGVYGTYLMDQNNPGNFDCNNINFGGAFITNNTVVVT
jgi:hypothetical protein